ncbi:Hypothetical predicted protein [Mytilus galloprovincialis]|uniref:CCHC-type domain-containing protein n=1 Tax=Mytilus galloprovincialis TaxID=29158 RepID=A0A8B6G8S8_MYTGA|nr:Hypothetical predicted protein [Mytilus galloprovincialis]
MSDESDSEIEFNMDKRETVEKNNEDSALNTVKQGQGDIESAFNNNVRDDIARQRNTVEMERNFEGEQGVSYFENNSVHERKWGNAPRFCREQLPIAGHPATIRPDAYSGSDDWEEYFSHFQDCAELGRWSTEDRVLTLAASLKGPARTFYMSLPTHERRPYSILVRRLEERFGSARQQNRWLSRFEMRTRNSGETVAALGDDLRQMVQKAYCNLDSLAQEVLALNQLYKSIPIEMKCRCVDRECKTVADAVDIIERYEALLGESSQKKTSVRSVSYENCSENKLDMEWQNNGDPNVRLISQQPNNDRTIQMLLSRMDKLENQIRNTNNRSNFRFGRNNYQNGSNTQNQRTCFICDSPDHFYRQCSMSNGHEFRENKPPNSQNLEISDQIQLWKRFRETTFRLFNRSGVDGYRSRILC